MCYNFPNIEYNSVYFWPNFIEFWIQKEMIISRSDALEINIENLQRCVPLNIIWISFTALSRLDLTGDDREERENSAVKIIALN